MLQQSSAVSFHIPLLQDVVASLNYGLWIFLQHHGSSNSCVYISYHLSYMLHCRRVAKASCCFVFWFQTDRPTVIEYDDHEYLFEGFSLFSHTPLTSVSLRLIQYLVIQHEFYTTKCLIVYVTFSFLCLLFFFFIWCHCYLFISLLCSTFPFVFLFGAGVIQIFFWTALLERFTLNLTKLKLKV